ncbi:MAG: beta-N-acetylhexosaminidase [Motiliproteus sp.]|jgi:beta-N-acetylhexosaminidase
MTAGPLMLDLEGTQLSAAERLLLLRPAVGGVILFSRNYHSPMQLRALTDSIRQLRAELLIAVDHEGGRVQRFRDGFTRIPAMATLGALWRTDPEAGLALARDCGWLFASELLAYGIDISFAPVLDLDRGISEVIGDRGFGADAESVEPLAAALMSGMHDAGMATTGKHYPGHGGVGADSHLEMPIDSRSFAELDEQDLRPFARFSRPLPAQTVPLMDAVMPAHVLYPACDDQPAGFSHFWLQRILRQQLGFDGVIFSDDLSMAGAELAGSYAERAAAAMTAGCDMVLVCNQPQAAVEVLEWLESEGLTAAARLPRMKARQAVDLEALQQTQHWARTQQLLATL